MKTDLITLVENLYSDLFLDLNLLFRPDLLIAKSRASSKGSRRPPTAAYSPLFVVQLRNGSGASRYLGLTGLLSPQNKRAWNRIINQQYTNLTQRNTPWFNSLEMIARELDDSIFTLGQTNRQLNRDLGILRRICIRFQNPDIEKSEFVRHYRVVLEMLSKRIFSSNIVSQFLNTGASYAVYDQLALKDLRDAARNNMHNDPDQYLGLMCESVFAPQSGLVALALKSWCRKRSALLVFTWSNRTELKQLASRLREGMKAEEVKSWLDVIAYKLSLGELLYLVAKIEKEFNERRGRRRSQRDTRGPHSRGSWTPCESASTEILATKRHSSCCKEDATTVSGST